MGKTKEQLLEEIKVMKDKLASVKGKPAEVYTRIVGYYRAVQNWNLGKKSEYADRVEFAEKPEAA